MLRELDLGDEDNACVIDPVRQDSRFKEINSAQLDNVCLREPPVSLEETCREAIRPWSFKRSNLKQDITDFFLAIRFA